MTTEDGMLRRALDTIAELVDAAVLLGFTLDAHQTIDRVVSRCARPEDELAVAPLVAKLPALEPIDPFSPRRAQAAGASVMWSAHVGGDDVAASSMYGRHLRRHGYAPPICVYFRTGGRIDLAINLLRRVGDPRFDGRTARLLAEWQPFLEDALTLADRAPGAPLRPALSRREAAVAALVATGRSNADVAGALGMTEATVKAHLTKVYAKLGVRNRTQLAVILPRVAVDDSAAPVTATPVPARVRIAPRALIPDGVA